MSHSLLPISALTLLLHTTGAAPALLDDLLIFSAFRGTMSGRPHCDKLRSSQITFGHKVGDNDSALVRREPFSRLLGLPYVLLSFAKDHPQIIRQPTVARLLFRQAWMDGVTVGGRGNKLEGLKEWLLSFDIGDEDDRISEVFEEVLWGMAGVGALSPPKGSRGSVGSQGTFNRDARTARTSNSAAKLEALEGLEELPDSTELEIDEDLYWTGETYVRIPALKQAAEEKEASNEGSMEEGEDMGDADSMASVGMLSDGDTDNGSEAEAVPDPLWWKVVEREIEEGEKELEASRWGKSQGKGVVPLEELKQWPCLNFATFQEFLLRLAALLDVDQANAFLEGRDVPPKPRYVHFPLPLCRYACSLCFVIATSGLGNARQAWKQPKAVYAVIAMSLKILPTQGTAG